MPDAIVVGGGHNGLVAAAYLLRAGLSVLVLEKRECVGGPAATVEWLPGYSCAAPNSPGSLEPRIVSDLDLPGYGLRFVKPDPTLIHPLDGGRLFAARRDHAKTAEQLDDFASGEAARYDAFFAFLERFARKLNVSLFEPPPTLRQLVERLETAEDEESFARVFFGSALDLLDLFLASDEAKTIIGALATVTGPGSPRIPGTTVNLLTRPFSLISAESVSGVDHDPRAIRLRGSTGLPVGGMGAVVSAMEAAVLSNGGTIRTGCAVAGFIIDDDHIHGVYTTTGEEFRAPVVISALSPRLTVLDLVPELDAWKGFKAAMRAKQLRGDECKVVLALDGPPRWDTRGTDLSLSEVASPQFRISPSIQYMEDAYASRLLGRVPVRPVIWGLTPSMTSPDLAPPGRHLMSLNLSAPSELRDGSWDTAGDLVVKNCIETLSEWIPGLPDQVLDARCMSPRDLEREYSLVGAEICHGDMLPANNFWMRPLPGLANYRTPTAGLYLSGAGTWPGNFVSGIPGYNASQAALADLRRADYDLANSLTRAS